MAVSYEATVIAQHIRLIDAKLTAMYEDETLTGGHADQDTPGASTAKNTEWRESLEARRSTLLKELHGMGYEMDSDGNPFDDDETFEIVTECNT